MQSHHPPQDNPTVIDCSFVKPQPLLYTTGITLKSFHLFLKLPDVLRHHIWLLAAPEPRTRCVEIHDFIPDCPTFRIRHSPRLPPLFHTCQESRDLSVRHEGGQIISFLTKPRVTSFYFNLRRDIMFLSSRFAGFRRSSTETYRLQVLEKLMPLFFSSQLQHVVVTRSGLDTYSRTGRILRDFKTLHTLFVVKEDWWSDETVRAQHNLGVPAPEQTKARIEASVRAMWAEDQKDPRLFYKCRFKVVEHELEMD